LKQNRTRILCIDDDEQIRFALQAVFDSQNWDSDLADGVEEGIRLFEKNGADIILIDYHLPNINGVTGVRLLRHISSDVPIIVFTIDDSQSVADEFLKVGASDFALKPIKALDIISRVRLHLRLIESQRRNRDSEQEDVMVKGIRAATLNLIRDAMLTIDAAVTVEQVAEETGLAYQTVYRYLQHLLSEEQVKTYSEYGKIGRPKQRYVWKTTD
jgi:two-component system response regulator DctR